MRTMRIEDAVRWAVRDELPKAPLDVVGGWIRAGAPAGAASPALASAVAGSLGGSMDARTNRFGVVPDMAALEAATPHPAALVIGEAMLALDVITPGGFDEWDAFEDLGPLAEDPIAGPLLAQAKRDAQAQARMVARMTGALSALMVKRAVLGPPTGWDAGEVRALVVINPANNKPAWFRKERRPAVWNAEGEVTGWAEVEVDGYSTGRGRPHADAYRKYRLDPDPLDVVMARAQWQLWRAALDVLAEDMADGRLDGLGLAVLPALMPMRPWVEAMPEGPRVLSGGPDVEPIWPREPRQAGRVITAMAAEEHARRYRREARQRKARAAGAEGA